MGEPGKAPDGRRRSMLERETTGIPNLDAVLGGGMPRGALVIVMGPPGSGKTILASQLAFASARRGVKTLFFSALSEPTSKLIQHIQPYSFFDQEIIGDQMILLSLQQFLVNGLSNTGDELVSIARDYQAGFIVLDGFRGVRGAEVDPQVARQFLYDVGTTLSLWGATTLITSEANPRDPVFFPETTTADVILGLHFDLHDLRDQRGFEVVKVRGSRSLPGLHAIDLNADGLTIYPKLESRIAVSGRDPAVAGRGVTLTDAPTQRVPFGLASLDDMLGGGVMRQTSTMINGGLGTGKTLLGLHYALSGVRMNEPTVFLTFRETLEQLQQKADAFTIGAELRAALARDDALILLRWDPVELQPDIVADRLLETIESFGAKRLVVDSITELSDALVDQSSDRRVANFLAALLSILRARDVTALFIREKTPEDAYDPDLAVRPLSILSENIITLQQIATREGQRRVITVRKTRLAAHDVRSFGFRIEAPAGLMLGEAVTITDGGASARVRARQTGTASSRSSP